MRTRRAIVHLLLLVACGGKEATGPTATEVRARPLSEALPRTDPAAAAWSGAPELVLKLLLQDQAPPKLEKESVGALRVRALHDDKWVAFRLEWDDPSKDELVGPARFGDMAAVQVPLEAGGSVPDAAMGQTGRAVRIHLWKAANERRLASKEDAIRALYPNALPDHYPPAAASAEARPAMELSYAPARAVHNLVTIQRDDAPTEDLLAEGFGSLSPAAEQRSQGRGVHDGRRWSVVIARPLDTKAGEALIAGARTYAAFAVWQGAEGNVGSRKMRSGWVALSLEVK